MLLRFPRVLAGDVRPCWGRWRLPTKVAIAGSMLVLGGMAHVGVIATGHIRENVVQRSATVVALYMDSFVERHVQELATRPMLSAENQEALGSLLSPATMHRPIVAFRVWRGDTIVFSNEHGLVGSTFARTASRERAWRGQVAAEFDEPHGDEHEQVRSLKVPILEVYAPVHEIGTGRIIALVETYEIGVELQREVFANQLVAWIAIVAIALAVVLLLFSMASTGQIERNSLLGRIAELTRLRVEREQHCQAISRASLQMSAMHERALQRLGEELYEGPTQLVALAKLKFDSLERLVARAKGAMPSLAVEEMEDLDAVRRSLDDALRHVRRLAGSLPLPDIDQLSLVETFASAVRHHERQKGAAVKLEAHGLPEQLPFSIKACLYRFALDGLDSVYAVLDAPPQSMRVSCDNERIVVEIGGGDGTLNAEPQPVAAYSPKFGSLRDRVEAMGGTVRFVPTPAGALSLIAEFSLPARS